jgi:hypothetical protein
LEPELLGVDFDAEGEMDSGLGIPIVWVELSVDLNPKGVDGSSESMNWGYLGNTVPGNNQLSSGNLT